MRLALIVLLPLLGAVLPPLMIRAGRNTCAAVTGAVSLASLALLLVPAPAVFGGAVIKTSLSWVEQINLEFAFWLDGWGFFFAALILVTGLLVILYARFYLGRDDALGRFYAYLLLFQGAMLGIVLADNVLLLVTFWELTSLTSFLLIGYWRHLPEGRQGARMALIVTGGGGLALIAGALLLAEAAGSFLLSEILAKGEVVRASPLYLPALLLVLLAAFTKSAQFPFHFWLPHAMAAPTPVSAYLHSATMVKAGVFLLGRLWPALAGTDAWFVLVSTTGLVTMVVAAWIALFEDDLKAILAFSTVSHLGLLTMLLGFGTPLAAVAAAFHVLNHCTFKAALFLAAGIVDHAAGSRDIRKLGGLMPLMPITATLAGLAAASMAGVPLVNGFLSKEMMLEEAARTTLGGLPWLVPSLATLAAGLSAAYAARFFARVFLGRCRADHPQRPRDPPLGMWLPAAALVVPVVTIGLAPAIAQPLVALAAGAVVGSTLPDHQLALWHGVTAALLMSILALAAGLAIFAAHRPLARLRHRFPRLDAKALFDLVIARLVAAAAGAVAAVDTGALQRSLLAALLVILAVGTAGFLGAAHGVGDRAELPPSLPGLAVWLVAVAMCAGVLRWHRHRLLALLLTGMLGLTVALTFVYFSAPDLALTQLSVEVVTTILMLLALNYLPRTTPAEIGRWTQGCHLAIAAAVGLGAAGVLYAVLTREPGGTIASYHLAQSAPGGGGTNVVNVILVDFRGYDTFGEIIVLAIAALAIFALLESSLSGSSGQRLTALPRRAEAKDRHPLLLVVTARVLLPMALTVGLFILLRGHNLPGGGFIAGLLVSIALILQHLASGFTWAEQRLPVDYHGLIALGVIVAGLTGLGAWYGDAPFLASSFGHFHLPVIGEVELATAMAFDLGVYLTVLGVVMLTLANLSRVGRKAEPQPGPAEPMDIKLPAAMAPQDA